MFERNILTFNPGWGANGQPLEDFTDVRDMQKQLKRQGYAFEIEADESTSGPASCIIVDPDGNSIILDQHI
jgi:lactoylglutathione lyase